MPQEASPIPDKMIKMLPNVHLGPTKLLKQSPFSCVDFKSQNS